MDDGLERRCDEGWDGLRTASAEGAIVIRDRRPMICGGGPRYPLLLRQYPQHPVRQGLRGEPLGGEELEGFLQFPWRNAVDVDVVVRPGKRQELFGVLRQRGGFGRGRLRA